MMPKYFSLLLLNLLIACNLSTKAQSQKIPSNKYDGPYVSYKGDSIVIAETYASSKEHIEPVRRSVELNQKSEIELNIRFSNDSTKNFTVRLRDKLENEKTVWKQPNQLFVISDVEGEFDAFRDLLVANNIINNKYEWTFGNGHLVVCGDLFDRGKDVPATIWLLYKLEEEAKRNGGYVHVVLGNHDIMNMAGDIRYVDKKYFRSAGAMGIDYMDLYTGNTELGRWLRTKNLVEKIGNTLYLHGGISKEVADLNLTIDELNKVSKAYYGVQKLKTKVSSDTVLNIYSGQTGLFWYRGYFKEPLMEAAVLDKILKQFQVKKIVVGHTILEGNIQFFYRGKVLAVDVNLHKNDRQAALYKNGKWYKLDLSGKQTLLRW